MEATGGFGASAPYDVFLSFRGSDTRDTFTDCLYRTMVGQGIFVYRDSEELHVGDRLDDLLRAVGESKICIPILSRGYASSAWCLRELACATELNESTGKPEILPIFFDVTPTEVKLRTELYMMDLEKHERRHGGEIRQRWEAALRKVGEIKGWEVQGKPYGKVIELVVREVMPKLKVKQRLLDDKLVGVDEQVEAIMELLDADFGTGVRFVGIHGMGGIGKTTLAKIVYNKLCPCFDGQCSFIENIRESSKGNGLVNLQKQLASDISDSRFVPNFSNTDEGIHSIIRRVGFKKVLIVLDDLEDEEQLKRLVGRPDAFCSGSKIIITTRDKRILDEESGILAYEVKQMDHDKALELFTWHAFKSVSPPTSHQNLSREVVSTTGGLPLALEVIGSFLHRKEIKIWGEMLEKLKKAPPKKVRDKLKICYESLGYREKEIFLDIACFLIKGRISRAIYFWDACDLSPRIALEELIGLCLIKIVEGDFIWMHDQLRDLGRDIVREESSWNLAGQSRLWNGTEALQVVWLEESKDKVLALNLVESSSDPIIIESMPNLKFLKLREGTFVGDINNHLPKLRWLSWYSPLRCTMANFHLENLAVLELSDIAYDENWGGWNLLKVANKLKDISLSRCSGLTRTPDFSGCLSLERLSLSDIANLQEVDSSIGKLKCLTHLDIFNCWSLGNLPEEIGGLVKMEHFFISFCRDMEKLPYSIWKLASLYEVRISCTNFTSLPDSIDDAQHLSSLDLSGTPIVELPISIGELTQLEFLSFSYCQRLQKIPKSIGNLTSLQELNLSYTSFVELPDSIGNLTSLQKLDLSQTSIVELPDSIENLKRLKVLRVRSSAISWLPANIGMLERLEELDASGCKQLEGELPIEIGKLSCLRILDLSNTDVSEVPTAINSLTRLQKLDLTNCNELQELPELPSSLNCLRVRSISLWFIPDLSNLTNLVELNLSIGSGQVLALASIPKQTPQLQWVGKLSELKKLSWGLSEVPLPSTELGCHPRLRELTFSGMDSFNSVVVGPKLSNLKNLSKLCLYRSPLREIQLDGLELLRHLEVSDCRFLEELSVVSSSMRKLCRMNVWSCPELLEIRFRSMMESLEDLAVTVCGSLGGVSGLSNLKKLKALAIYMCDGLQVVEGLEELELLACLRLERCGSLERLIDVSNSKIPNECWIHVSDCVKLPSANDRTMSYGDYREMILEMTRKTFNEEVEIKKDSEDSTKENYSIVCLEDLLKENDTIDCLEDSEDLMKENNTIDCLDLEDSTKENDSIDCSMCILECICKPLMLFQGRSHRR